MVARPDRPRPGGLRVAGADGRAGGRTVEQTEVVRVLLSEGSGLTSRQVAGRLAAVGHEVGVLSSDPFALTRLTRATRHWHRAPAFGPDPFAWLDRALDVYRQGAYDVLFPTQEQVAVLAAAPSRLEGASVATAVPSFAALSAVQDKVSAQATLAGLGVPQPDGTVVTDRHELAHWDRFPVWAKAPIGTATSGVAFLGGATERDALLATGFADQAIAGGGVLLQASVDGPLAMVQAVFADGVLVAFHANLRARAGVRGGASGKLSIDLPEARRAMATLGEALGWHGALSFDVIVTGRGPLVIDVNPRLVEPGNALASGTDLTATLLAVASGPAPDALRPTPVPSGVATHQLLLALLEAARHRGRPAVLGELADAIGHRRTYADSTEELTPLRGDWEAVLPLAAVTVATLIHPPWWEAFSSGSVANYALTPEGWQAIVEQAEVPPGPRP